MQIFQFVMLDFQFRWTVELGIEGAFFCTQALCWYQRGIPMPSLIEPCHSWALLMHAILQFIHRWNLLALRGILLVPRTHKRIFGVKGVLGPETLESLHTSSTHCTRLCLSMKGVVLMHHLISASWCIKLLSIDLGYLTLLCVDYGCSLVEHHCLLTCLNILLGRY